MKIDANYQTLVKVLQKTSDNYIVPLFQRRYSWLKEQCEDLWNDFIRLVRHPKSNQLHFIGAVVFQEIGTYKGIHRSLIIDGQQRLMTLSLLIAAMRDRINRLEKNSKLLPKMEELLACPNYKDEGDGVEGMEEIREGYFRIHPSEKDKSNYYSIIGGKPELSDPNSNIYKAYDYFLKKLEEYRSVDEIENIYNTLIYNIGLVVIVTDSDYSPYEVFATLNQRGLKLTEADLIRNHLFDQIKDENLQKKYYVQYFKPIENTFDDLKNELIKKKKALKAQKLPDNVDDPDTDYLSEFIYRFWAAYKRDIIPYNKLVNEITREIRGQKIVEEFLERLKIYSKFYVSFILPFFESDPEVQMALEDIKRLGETTFYPLLLELFYLRHQNQINNQMLSQMIRVIENVLIRRRLFGKNVSGLNKDFPKVITKMEENQPSLEILIAAITSVIYYPTNEEIKHKVKEKEFYGGGKNDYVRLMLIQLNRSYKHDAGVHYMDAEIEHILPLSHENWKKNLPENEVQKLESFPSMVNWLGNLTLINSSYNKKISNEPFEIKRMEFDKSPYMLTKKLVEYTSFTPSTIEQRTQTMIDRLLDEVYPNLTVKYGVEMMKEEWMREKSKRIISFTVNGKKVEIEKLNWKNVLLYFVNHIIEKYPAVYNMYKKKYAHEFQVSVPKLFSKLSNGDDFRTTLSAIGVMDRISKFLDMANLPKDYVAINYEDVND